MAKTASLLQDELGLTRGDRLLVDLPPHWLGPVWLGAAWSLGLVVSPAVMLTGVPGPPDAVVCGPGGVERYAGAGAGTGADGVPVVALSLLPMATRFPTALPEDVLDYGLVVWGQPDAFVPYDPAQPEDPAWEDDAGSLTQADVVGLTTGRAAGDGTVRLLTDRDPLSRDGLPALLEPLRTGGGTVWVANAAPDGWDVRAAAEHVTAVLRG